MKKDPEMQDLVVCLRAKKAALVREWLKRVVQIPGGYQKFTMDDLAESCSMAFDCFCELLENDNFGPMDEYIPWVTKARTARNITLTELQHAFTNFRYTVFPEIIKRYSGAGLLAIIAKINHYNDLVVFRFSNYFQWNHEKELKEYADRLETEVRERTKDLEESQKRYLTLVEGISDGCFLVDDDRLIFVNRAFCNMHGCAPQDALKKVWWRFIAKGSRKTVLGSLGKLLHGEDCSKAYVYDRQDKQKREYPTEIKLKTIEYGGKKLVLGLCSDITERVAMEQKLQQRDRLALIGKLTTSIAHEVRNPLSAIEVNTQLLLDNLGLHGNNLRRLQIANEQSKKLEDIISEILNFAKPICLKYTISSIYPVIDRTIEFFQQRIDVRKARVVLTKKLSRNLPNVLMDHEKLQQTIFNVTSNAFEALDKNKKNGRIEFIGVEETRGISNYIKLSIVDNGVGMDAHDLDYIFEPFFTKGKKEGVGLGLSNVKRIVDAHHGLIDVKTKRGAGTSFEIYIPVHLFQ